MQRPNWQWWCLGCAFTLAATAAVQAVQDSLGYQDTPVIPGTIYHVHDGTRPQPRLVAPGEHFSELASAPSDAVVLFGGGDLSRWQRANGEPAMWPVNNEYFESTRGGAIRTKDKFVDFQLHLEFATPTTPHGTGQARGNSGILINGMYEVQVLDSFESPTYPDGQCGALYGQSPPLVNACRRPGAWQTYDLVFESPRWDEGKLIKQAAVTVIQNGVVLHHRREYIGCTDGIGGVAHKSLAAYGPPHDPAVFIELQDHGNPVRYRNVWVRPLGQYDQG